MKNNNIIKNLSIDMGSSSVRIYKNYFINKKLISQEIKRFQTSKIINDNKIIWDYKKIFNNLVSILSEIKEEFESISINGWGCDYVILDKVFKIIINPRTYRDSSLDNIVSTFETNYNYPLKKIYMKNGHIISKISSVMQLYRDFEEKKDYFKRPFYFLNIPDLFNFMLTGIIKNEISIFSTSGLLFNNKIPSEYNFISNMKLKISDSLSSLGFIREDIISRLKIGNPEVILVSSHDTSSGIASLNIKKNDIFLSLGSWNIMGFISEKPIISNFCYKNKITNEISAYKKYKILKNMNGLFLLQKLLKSWKKKDPSITYKKIINLAKKEKSYKKSINIDDEIFHSERDIFLQINEYFKIKKWEINDKKLSVYAIIIYNGIVDSIAKTYKQLDYLLKNKNKKIFIFGGGIKDKLLIKMIRERINKNIIICSEEASCVGNSIQQLIYKNHIKSPREVKKIILKK